MKNNNLKKIKGIRKKLNKAISKYGNLFMKNTEKEDMIKNFLQKRISENKKLFSKKELEIIEKNISIFKKIYILGLSDLNDIKN